MMKNKQGPFKGFTPQELEVILRAKREHKLISFEGAFPQIVEKPVSINMTDDSIPLSPLLADEPKVGSILSPVNDLLNLFASLEGYLSYYVSELSKTDLRREDCLHMYEPSRSETAMPLSDTVLKKITEKLRQITAERRHIKNRYEIIKFIQHSFMTDDGKVVRTFLSKLLHDVAYLEKSQKERVYTPKTNTVSDILAAEHPAEDEKNSTTVAAVTNAAHTNLPTDTRTRSDEKRRGPHVNN